MKIVSVLGLEGRMDFDDFLAIVEVCVTTVSRTFVNKLVTSRMHWRV